MCCLTYILHSPWTTSNHPFASFRGWRGLWATGDHTGRSLPLPLGWCGAPCKSTGRTNALGATAGASGKDLDAVWLGWNEGWEAWFRRSLWPQLGLWFLYPDSWFIQTYPVGFAFLHGERHWWPRANAIKSVRHQVMLVHSFDYRTIVPTLQVEKTCPSFTLCVP